MSFGILLDDRYKLHEPGHGHPERPERLDAIHAALEGANLLDGVLRIEPEPVDRVLLERLHDPEYIERLERVCKNGEPYIDAPDSCVCPRSYEIALLAAGGVAQAAREIGSGRIRRAFCAVRPPGHHAERDRSMGFCMFNNIAVAAETFRHELDLKRIAILDWDVHHGNATQHMFEDDPSVLFISLHGDPARLYPGTGYASESGTGAGEGYTLNIPFNPGEGDAAYREAFEAKVSPALERFKPQALLVSCGFDAHADDPLAFVELSDQMYPWMTRYVIDQAERHCDGRLLSVLEGGYDLNVLTRCVPEHVRLLRDPDASSVTTIEDV